MKVIFYLFLTLVSLTWLKLGTDLQPMGTRGELDLCDLRESERGRVTGIITAFSSKDITLTKPNSGCTAIVSHNNFAQELKGKNNDESILQRGVSFTALVQGGFLKLPTDISLEDNLGKVVPYQKKVGIILAKPKFKYSEKFGIVEIWEQSDKSFFLYIPRNQVRNIRYKELNTIYYNSNNEVVQID
ncbi:MAG: hypothetical protein RLZZ499_2108 [Cyanobacteriota bacterium]|jgi:hypothetical protein